MYFNQDQLVTSADGNYVGWTNDHGSTVVDVYTNTLDHFWLTLSAEHGIV